MPYSIAGLFGAALALAFGFAGYRLVILRVQARLRSIAPRDTQVQRDDLEFKLGVMRRLVLAVGAVAFAWAGYWCGKAIG